MDTADVGAATAAPREFKLHGETVRLYPLRFMEWGEIEQWMRTQIINATRDSIKGNHDLTQQERQAMMRGAVQEAARISIATCLTEKEGQPLTFLQTFEGMLRVIHSSLRDGNSKFAKPVFTLDELDEKLNSDFNLLTDMFEIAFDLSFVGLVEEEPKNPQAVEQSQ